MDALDLELSFGGRSQRLRTTASRVVLGKGGASSLRVPLSWLADQELELRYDAGLLRVRALTDRAELHAGSQLVEKDWVVLPPDCELGLRRGGEYLALHIRTEPHSGMTVLSEADADTGESGDLYAGAVIAGPDGAVAQIGAEDQSHKPEVPSLRPPPEHRKLRAALMVVAVGMPLLILGVLVLDFWRQERRKQQDIEAHLQLESLVAQARNQIKSGEYKTARATLVQADAKARSNQWENELAEVRVLLAKPEIQLGANGYVQMHGKWVDPPTAAAWREAEQLYEQSIGKLLEQARMQLRESMYAEARSTCAEALVLMDKFPEAAKPHPALEEAHRLDKDAQDRSLAKEMIAKGMVLYKAQWMTPDDRFRAQQREKGLEEYKGKWLTKDEVFAARQIDRGLVLYNGKWMTPDEKLQAQGYVQFEGKWITPAEQTQILADREAARSAQAAEKERQKQEAARVADERRRQEQAIETDKPAAYSMSQVFLKKALKHPLSAQFPNYTDNSVIVIYKDGWYLVRATVKAENESGTLVGRHYVSKLRRKSADTWETEFTGVLDE